MCIDLLSTKQTNTERERENEKKCSTTNFKTTREKKTAEQMKVQKKDENSSNALDIIFVLQQFKKCYMNE